MFWMKRMALVTEWVSESEESRASGRPKRRGEERRGEEGGGGVEELTQSSRGWAI